MKKRSSVLLLVLLLPLPLAARGADEVVAPNENLVADGLPAIPKSLAERVSGYLDCAGARRSRRGTPCAGEMLIGTRFADVFRDPPREVPRRRLARSSRSTPNAPAGSRYRPHTGEGFVFNKDVGGGEWYQLFWRDEKTGKVTMFTDGKSRNTGGDFSRSGKWLGVPVDETQRQGQRHLRRGPGGARRPSGRSSRSRAAVGASRTGRWTTRRSSWGSTCPRTRAGTGSWTPRRARRRSRRRRRRRRSPGAAPSSRRTESRSTRRRTRVPNSTASSSLDLASKKITVLTPGVDWDVQPLKPVGGRSAARLRRQRGRSRYVPRVRHGHEEGDCAPEDPSSGRSAPSAFTKNGKDLGVHDVLGAVPRRTSYSIDVTAGPSGGDHAVDRKRAGLASTRRAR